MKRYIYNPETLSYDVKEEPKIAYILRAAITVVLVIVLVTFWIWLYRSVFGLDYPKTAFLKAENASWNARMGVLNRQLELYDVTLRGIEERDNDVYRSIFGLDTIAVIPVSQDSASPTAAMIAAMEARAVIRSESLDSIGLMASQAGDMVSHVPAVPPILPARGTYRISSSFGYRRDPVYGYRAHHEGEDFATRAGNPIYVTADGVVESVNYNFGGYGNEVLVNHGFGYKTRYAHMKLVSVTEGMKLRRGDCLGTVGRSGKSTGPHLHYEVIYKGKRLNPANFMDLEMSVPEYRAMINEREQARNARVHRSSTTEILRKRR